MKNILFLASKSYSRKMLLEQAGIVFNVVEQDVDETQCDWGLPLPQLVQDIALHKMNHIILPPGKREGQVCFVLTADTLSQDLDGKIHGKPVDRADAIAKIKSARKGSRLCTAFCLDKRMWKSGRWELVQREQRCVPAEYEFVIPDEWIDIYLEKSIGLQASNAIAIEEFGAQFLRSVHGSYTTIVGLPMFELREALSAVGFFFPLRSP
ncbi:MAG: Maf family protein [bacterium]|nr:Maf family protein [bacterium]